MDFYIIENSNNKLHEIVINETSIFISYTTPVCLYHAGTFIINSYYKNYSHTTNRHLNLCQEEYKAEDIIYVNNDMFNKLLFRLEHDPESFKRTYETLFYTYEKEKDHLQRIRNNDLNNMPPVTTSTLEKQELKTRNKNIDHATTTTGVKFKVITTYDKKGNLLKESMKLDKNYNLLSEY